MADIRRALVFASVGRYAARAVNLATTVVIARMMGPTEFGVSVLGGSVFLILEAIRELASVNYLVQQQDLTRDKINSAFTVSLTITAILTIAILLLAHPMAALYHEPRLASYLHVMTIGFTLGPFMQPMYALWSRALAFRTIAGMDVLAAVTTAVVSIVLVRLGFSYMGLAWGSTVSGVIGVAVALWFSRHELAIFRLSLKEWRGVLAFGLFGSATAMIYRLSDAFSFLVFGKMLDTRAVGLLQRTFTLATFPETVILAGVNSVALPAFSHQARSGANLKDTYLSAVSHVAAVQWPTLAFISAMATPLTRLVLGPRWMEVAPLVQIVAIALMLNFTARLNFPVLVAIGLIRKTLPIAIVQVVLSQVITIWAASMGLRAIAFSGFATAALALFLWMGLVRKHIPFSLGELFMALHKSLIILLASAIGPIAVLIYSHGAPSIPEAGVAGILWLGGWLLAVRLTGHPLRSELSKAPGFIARRLALKKNV